MGEAIRGSVAQILNERELVINRGTEHGVEVGMRFAVLNRNGANIVDPETGEELGSVDVEKTLVKVVRVQDRVSVARTFRTFYEPATGIGVLSGLAGRPGKHVPETLRTTDSTYQAEIDEKDSYIKRGDPVVQVVKDEFLED